MTSPGNGSEPALGPAQPKKIRGVGFGDIFKEGSVKLKTRLSSNESEDKRPEDKKQDKVCSGTYCSFGVSCKNNLGDVESDHYPLTGLLPIKVNKPLKFVSQ